MGRRCSCGASCDCRRACCCCCCACCAAAGCAAHSASSAAAVVRRLAALCARCASIAAASPAMAWPSGSWEALSVRYAEGGSGASAPGEGSSSGCSATSICSGSAVLVIMEACGAEAAAWRQ
jgi:hypothetical protein